jgi:hypothetical protein
MEAGVQQPPAKKPKRSMADFYKTVAKAMLSYGFAVACHAPAGASRIVETCRAL